MCVHAQALQLRPTVCDPMDCSLPPRPWGVPGKNTRVGWHDLLQGIFPTQGLNSSLLCLLHCRQILYPLSHLGSPKPIYRVQGPLSRPTQTYMTPPTGMGVAAKTDSDGRERPTKSGSILKTNLLSFLRYSCPHYSLQN